MFNDVKFYIGPMSKNIVDTIIKFSNDNNIKIGLIPSRRQIDYNNGYVGWKTDEFIKYVKNKTNSIIIERDHGGINQGIRNDIGIKSFQVDAKNDIDIIHIDPWKYYKNYNDGLNYTVWVIKYIHNNINKKTQFEIGTEESIRKFDSEEIDIFLKDIKNKLGSLFNKISYIVVQSGTNIKDTKNIGIFNPDKLKEMVNISNKYGLLTKEHNGDYLSNKDIRKRFDIGLSSINIAPEFGVFETDIILNNINNKKFDNFFDICYKSNKWKKWVDNDFEPLKNKKELIRICGHYQFNNKEFKKLNLNLDNIIQKELYKKIKNLII